MSAPTKDKEVETTILVSGKTATLILPRSFVELVGIDRDVPVKASVSGGALVVKKADR